MTTSRNSSALLGALITMFPSTVTRNSGWPLLPMLAVLAIIALWLSAANLVAGLLLFGLMGFLGGLWLLEQSRRRIHVQVFERGLLYTRGSKSIPIRWDAVALTRRNYRWTFSNQTDYVIIYRRYSVTTNRGQTLVFGDSIAGLDELSDWIEQQVRPYLLPAILTRYAAGEQLAFGPLRLDASGVQQKNRSATWAQVEAIDVHYGTLSIRIAGQARPMQAEVAQIPNFFIVQDILRPHRAALLARQGDYAGARTLYEQALAIHVQILGPQHPETATILNNLAALLYRLGDDAAAKPLYMRALAINEQVLGPQHPSTAAGLNNLAVLLDREGDYAGARALYERALAIAEQTLGPQHPGMAASLSNLAVLFDHQGDYAGARALYERALAIHEQVLGPQHPSTATSLNNLALLLDHQGDHAGARLVYERALAICEHRFGADHPTTRTVRQNLASLAGATSAA